MNKSFLTLIGLLLSVSLLAQMDIVDARNEALGNTVTIEGIATNGEELGIIRYIQDATGGIAVYPGTGSAPNFPETVDRGDLVEITGTLKEFNGLLEIDPITSFNIISSNNPLPATQVIAANGIDATNEGEIVTVNGVVFEDGGSVFNVGNFTFSANGQEGEIYIRSNHPLIGTDIPLASVNLTGIASRFMAFYQLLPRDIADLEIADDFYFTQTPKQGINITTDGFSVTWKTNNPGTTTLTYGTTIDMDNELTGSGTNTDHSANLTGLDPAEFYYVQAVSQSAGSTIYSPINYFSTASTSTGAIRVYFNNGVDGSYSTGAYPDETTPAALEGAIIDKINNAQSTIDASIYNINRESIVAALTEAHNNGIQVRYVADDETANLALSDPTPPFPVIKGNSGSPLMHNKFFAIDAESENDSWVIMGSTNMTSNNISSDFNNMVMIQDKALAKAYTVEFNEMWGSDGPSPGVFNLKFGDDKADNTPHLFMVNDVLMESYFSPSDNTSIAIANALATADDDIQFALLTFTKNELGAAILNAHNDGVSVRGVIDNINDQGSEYDYLQSNGVNVIPDGTTTQTHHKYAIIDATNPASDPQVITGSHNWSSSADTRNDENTLIIHDAKVANIFLQEFEARWCEFTSGTDCVTSTTELKGIDGFEVSLSPNPASDYAQLVMTAEQSTDLAITLWSVDGRRLQSILLNNVQGQANETLTLTGLPAGQYTVTFEAGNQGVAKPLVIVK